MTPFSKYLWGLAIAGSVIFSAYEAGCYWMPASISVGAETPQWKLERLARDPTSYLLPAASLTPIYPASPGKELLRKSVVVASGTTQRLLDSPRGKAAEKPVRSALILSQLPRKLLNLTPPEKYSQQRMGYTAEATARLERVSFGHGLY
jgi:hypothetical protein